MKRFVFVCLLVALDCLAVRGLAQYDFNLPPVRYADAPASDPIARLQKKILAGKVVLKKETSDFGYLRSVLHELKIPQSSQTLVFSKTSFQREAITPKTPRALYFDDDTYIGYVQGGDVVEVATTDPNLGTLFYTLDQHGSGKPKFLRQTDNCLQCHAGSMTRDVPGLLLRSVFTDPRGQAILNAGTKVTTQESPFDERFGGWYATGRHGGYERQRHLGNLTGKDRDDPDPIDPKAGADITDLSKLIDTSAYLTPHSDLIALMVLAHQTEAHNLMTRANYGCLHAERDARIMNKALSRPLEEESDSTRRRIESPAEALLRYLLFCDEAALQAPITGTSGFTREFAARGPRDSHGRSLRDFDLTTRMFKYPLSYLIYSDGFNGLPTATKQFVYQRLFDILTGKETAKEFRHLTKENREAILEILRDTKSDLPPYWHVQKSP